MDESELFIDFELEKEQEVMGIASVTENSGECNSSIKSDEKEEEVPPSPGVKSRDRKISDNSEKLFDERSVIKILNKKTWKI